MTLLFGTVLKVPKKCYSAMPIFDDFGALLNIIFSVNFLLRHCWWLVLQCRSKGCSLVPIFDDNRLCWKFIFFGGNVVLRHCWGLVNQRRWGLEHQCRKECYSTMPTFDNFSALQIIFLISGGNVVLRRCWWLLHQCRKMLFNNANFWWFSGTA